MKKIFFISLIFSFTIFGQSEKLTLEECLQIGLQNSRQIKISESVLRSTDEKVTEFTSQMLPKLNLSAGYTYMNLNNPTEIGFGPAPIQVQNPFSLSLYLNVTAALANLDPALDEAADGLGAGAWRRFFRITLPLIRPAIMVAVIFRILDALRIFDLIYVLTPNSSATETMSVVSRENLIEFDKFAYGSAQSTLLFLLIALFTILYIWLGRVKLDEGGR